MRCTTPLLQLLHARSHPSSLLVEVPLQTHVQPRGSYESSNTDQSDANFRDGPLAPALSAVAVTFTCMIVVIALLAFMCTPF